MTRGYQPSIPLASNTSDGPYALTKEFNANAKQNLKMILLTEKGEKLTDIEFGCGLRRFLFEPEHTVSVEEIDTEIREQVRSYAPYIEIEEVDVFVQEEVLSIRVGYLIEPTNTTEQEMFEVTT
jgi:uncharacterized protein